MEMVLAHLQSTASLDLSLPLHSLLIHHILLLLALLTLLPFPDLDDMPSFLSRARKTL
jgi:hypothetical protein